MNYTTSALVEAVFASVESLAEHADSIESKKPVLLKALANQDRFKLSSVWIELEDGTFQHLQSARITTAARLAGYTRVINRG